MIFKKVEKLVRMRALTAKKRDPRRWTVVRNRQKNCDTLLDVSVSSLRRGHANLLCIVPILADDPRGVPI